MSLPVVIIDLQVAPSALVDIIKTRVRPGVLRYTPAKLLKVSLAPALVKLRHSRLIVREPVRILVRSKISSRIIPVGLSFGQIKGDGDQDGTFDFPLSSRIMGMDSAYYYLGCDDTHFRHGPADTCVWKCCIAVQLKDGTIGIIDPEIENQD